MRARPGMSVHREDAQRDAEAREAGIRQGIEMSAAFLDAIGKADAAAELRAATIAQAPAEAEAAA